MNCYVYTYSINRAPVYVGIGTHGKAAYQRAMDLKGHPEIQEHEYPHVQIVVVGDLLSREDALCMETMLIQTLGSYYTLRNQQVSVKHMLPEVIKEAEGEGEQNVRHTLSQLLVTQKQAIVQECLSHLKAMGLSAVHDPIYLESEYSTAERNALQALMPGYDPHVDSINEQFHEWWRKVRFTSAVEIAVVVVPWEAQAVRLSDVVNQHKFGVAGRAVWVVSLEQWLRTIRLVPENYRLARHMVRTYL